VQSEIIFQTSILHQQVIPKWHIVSGGKIVVVMLHFLLKNSPHYKKDWLKWNQMLPTADELLVAYKKVYDDKPLSETEENLINWYIMTIIPIVHVSSRAKNNWRPFSAVPGAYSSFVTSLDEAFALFLMKHYRSPPTAKLIKPFKVNKFIKKEKQDNQSGKMNNDNEDQDDNEEKEEDNDKEDDNDDNDKEKGYDDEKGNDDDENDKDNDGNEKNKDGKDAM